MQGHYSRLTLPSLEAPQRMEGGKTEAFSKSRKSLPKSTVSGVAESYFMKITVTSQKISKTIENLIHELENIIYTCVCKYKKSLTIQGDLPSNVLSRRPRIQQIRN